MKTLHGIGVSPGIAIGEAFVLGSENFRIPKHAVLDSAVDSEVSRLKTAITDATTEIAFNRDNVTRELGSKYGDIFEAQYQILADPELLEQFRQLIVEKHHTAEYSVSVIIRRYADVFRRLESSYMAERVNDILDIEKRLLRHLLGEKREVLSTLKTPVLVLASNLTPSETASLNREFVLGFVTELGSAGGHTAIVAAALEIPAVVGVGPFLNEVSGGDLIVIDGSQGDVVLRPGESALATFQNRQEQKKSQARVLESLRDLPAMTTDGVEIQLLGNIEFPYETQHCLDRGALGIGLYRTEFLYLGHRTNQLPSEEEHFQAYRKVAEAMHNRPVTIRTYDLGSDKLPDSFHREVEKNPQLGMRSIRLSLRNVPLFRDQLRAILRASAYGDVRVMFPLVTTLLELRQAKMILEDIKEEMYEQSIEYNPRIKVGIMVEVPATAIRIRHFIREVDFISLGTNDLVQYTLAVDRTNRDVANLYQSEDPAVLYLIHETITVANKHGVPVSLCGQMGNNPLYTKLLVGMGLRILSCSPNYLPGLKQVIRGTTIAECEEIAKKVLQMESDRDVRSYLNMKNSTLY